jgi:hypothetical protein
MRTIRAAATIATIKDPAHQPQRAFQLAVIGIAASWVGLGWTPSRAGC